MKKSNVRLLSLLLAVIMILGIMPLNALAEGISRLADQSVSEEQPTVVIAGSDFRHPDGQEASASETAAILRQIALHHPTAQGFFACGNYAGSQTEQDSLNGKTALEQTVMAAYPAMDAGSLVWVQGDRDKAAVGALSAGGAHDTKEYGVYVINENDFPSVQTEEEATVRNTAAALQAYLDAKAGEKYVKPIFVLSHVPLHYSMSTYRDGSNIHADLLFDVLNRAGSKGLNIIFLYGHNNDNGWDDYLGGSSVYLTRGDEIRIPEGTHRTNRGEMLNFTYMNAGYLGGYEDTGSQADHESTMTVFEITTDRVLVSRYDKNGLHNLKSAGVWGGNFPDHEFAKPVYTPNTTVYPSTQMISLRNFAYGEESVTADGMTFTVEFVHNLKIGPMSESEKAILNSQGYVKYAAYNLDGWIEPGKKAVIHVRTSGTWHGNFMVGISMENGVLTEIPGVYENGVFTFEVDHFSLKGIAEKSPASLTQTADSALPGAAVVKELTSIEELKDGFLISSVCDPQHRTVSSLTTGFFPQTLKLNKTVNEENLNLFFAEESAPGSGKYYLRHKETGRYLSITKLFRNSYTALGNQGDAFILSYQNGSWIIWIPDKNYYLGVDTSNTEKVIGNRPSSKPENQWKFCARIPAAGDPVTMTVPSGITMMLSIEKQKTILPLVKLNDRSVDLSACTLTWASSDERILTVNRQGQVTAIREGQADVTVTLTAVNGVALLTPIDMRIPVTVTDKHITDISVSPMEGKVERAADPTAKTGSVLTVTYDDGTTATVDVTVSMLTGNYDIRKSGTYTNLNVSYGGKTVTGYTLTVANIIGNDYPDYPDEGAVRVDKSAEGIDFQASGIARVELSATGVPTKKGVDVVVMVDTSGSMNREIESAGVTTTRIAVLRDSLNLMMEQFRRPGEDGKPMDIRVAVADFNNYIQGGECDLDTNDVLVDAKHRNPHEEKTWGVFTGDKTLTAGALQNVHDIPRDAFSRLGPPEGDKSYGTNYDYAFDAIYRLVSDIQAQNHANRVDREVTVVFMSDGCPFQYNYFSSTYKTANWNDWLTGTWNTPEEVPTESPHRYYYNGRYNKHRMAEAIKGDPEQMYTVIRKVGGDNLMQLPGLGVPMYSIGFALADNGEISVNSTEFCLKNLCTDPAKYYYRADTPEALSNAFTDIAGQLTYAATEAHFVDTMGKYFNLQAAMSRYKVVENGQLVERTITPDILVQSYEIYTRADYEAGLVSFDQIGVRTGVVLMLERVTFNERGTEAYSNTNPGVNILKDGVICADTFFYNMNPYDVDIDINGDGVGDYRLPPETFYWILNTVRNDELTLSYDVYLDGSMEGLREAGSYPTNESATLYYINWLGNAAHKSVPSPHLAWEAARISYAFYLVDENGQVIVNRDGTVGSFTNRVVICQPTPYQEVLLNSGASVKADISADSVLPEGYRLYDTSAAYSVTINSNSTGSWSITNGMPKETTYVTGYRGQQHSHALNEDSLAYDYTNTVVWFAVTYTVSTIPDTVVIDYGIPVNVAVMQNDLFYLKGDLRAIGAYKTDADPAGESILADGFTDVYTGQYGTARIVTNGQGEKVLSYTLNKTNGMQMSEPEKLSYAVAYTREDGTTAYYYGRLTVIPASFIYYEEDYLTFTDSTAAHDQLGVWTEDGTVDTGAVQAEDHPGFHNVGIIDANFVYGYDGAYSSCTQYSNGGAMKVTVDAASGAAGASPKVTFTFTGTGFDVISLTDNVSGAILVTVRNAATGEVAATKTVDNYYGYTYGTYTDEDGQTHTGFYVDKTSTDTIWQVPVIKIEDLSYDTYTVTIDVAHMKKADHNEDGLTTFYMDSIRIYDPALGNAEAEDAYHADGEEAFIVKLKDILLDGTMFDQPGTALNGVVFIDGKDATSDRNDYRNPGPNNETYLAVGEGISFKLTDVHTPDSIQLGVKLAYGTSGTLKFNQQDLVTVTTATDMYYTLPLKWNKVVGENGMIHYETDTITLSNGTETASGQYDTSAVISLTNLKICGAVHKPEIMVTHDVLLQGTSQMRQMYGDKTVRPDDAESMSFVPAFVDAYVLAASPLVNGQIRPMTTVMVMTSEDVESVTVNGIKVDRYVLLPVRSQVNGSEVTAVYRAWIFTTDQPSGGLFDVVAYNLIGQAAAPMRAAHLTTVSR